MQENTLFAPQLDFIRYLHQIRSPLLDSVIKLFDFLDRQEFFFILIPIVWLGFGSRFGMRIFYLMALNHIINFQLKNLFSLPRPFHLEPALGIIQVKGYGFPSGAAQSAILLPALLLIYWKSRWRWVIATVYALMLSFSRLYLGVHFPMDIVSGWIIGFLLLVVYLLIFPKVEKFLERRSLITALIISFTIFGALMLWMPSRHIMGLGGCTLGLGIGIFINRMKKVSDCIPINKVEFWTRIIIGILGIFFLYGLCSKTFSDQLLCRFILFMGIAIWMSCGVPYLCNKLSPLWKRE